MSLRNQLAIALARGDQREPPAQPEERRPSAVFGNTVEQAPSNVYNIATPRPMRTSQMSPNFGMFRHIRSPGEGDLRQSGENNQQSGGDFSNIDIGETPRLNRPSLVAENTILNTHQALMEYGML